MNYNWKLTSAILVVLAVPFALAIYDDSDRDAEAAAAEFAARYGLEEADLDDYGYEDPSDYDYDDDYDGVAAIADLPRAMDGEFFERSFFAGGAGVPQLGGTFEGLRLGMTSGEAIAWRNDNPIDDLCGDCDSEFIFDDEQAFLSGVSVSFPDDGTARRMFTSRWGDPGRTPSEYGSSQYVWLNPEARLRLRLQETDYGEAYVVLERYAPISELIGVDRRKGLLVFGESLMGMKAVAVDELLSVSHRDEYSMLAYLPPTDRAMGMTSVRVALDGEKVEMFSISFETPDASLVRSQLSGELGDAEDLSSYQDGSHLQWKRGKIQMTVDGPLVTVSAH